jgi:hypothetical protein
MKLDQSARPRAAHALETIINSIKSAFKSFSREHPVIAPAEPRGEPAIRRFPGWHRLATIVSPKL